MTTDRPTPDVSIVVVTFDRLSLLPRALDSIVRQTFPLDRFEVVVVNDAGTDPSHIVNDYRNLLDIQLVSHEFNAGVAAALNTGVTACTGRYICFLADDDLYYPRHLQALFEEAESLGGTSLVYSDAIKTFEDDAGNAISRLMNQVPAEFQRDLLLVSNYIPGHCLMVPSVVFDTVGLFDESFDALEDWDMWIRATELFAVGRVLEATAELRWRQTTRTNNTTRDRPKHFTCLERLYAKHPVSPQLTAARAQHLENSRPIADEFAFELSVLVLSSGDIPRLQSSLVSIVEKLGEDGPYEVVIHAPRTPDVLALAASIDGDITFVYGETDDHEAVWSILERKAAGRLRTRLVESQHLHLG